MSSKCARTTRDVVRPRLSNPNLREIGAGVRPDVGIRVRPGVGIPRGAVRVGPVPSAAAVVPPRPTAVIISRAAESRDVPDGSSMISPRTPRPEPGPAARAWELPAARNPPINSVEARAKDLMLIEVLIIHLLSSRVDLQVFRLAFMRASSTPLRRVITMEGHIGRPGRVFSQATFGYGDGSSGRGMRMSPARRCTRDDSR